MLQTLFFSLLIVAICLILLGIKVFFVRGGKFPNGHVSGNKVLRDKGIHCAQTQDWEAQQEGEHCVNEK